MKKTISLLLISTALLANNQGYVPFSNFTDNQQAEYNFTKVKAEVKEETNTYKKVMNKTENEPKIISVEKIPTIKLEEIKKEKVVLEKKVEPKILKVEKIEVQKAELQVESTDNTKIIEVSETKVIEKKTIEPIRSSILSNSVKLEEDNEAFNDLTVDLRFEYSPTNVKYSMNGSTKKTSPDSFSPTLSLTSGIHTVELDYFMTDALLETTWYKMKYKRKVNDKLNLGFGINRYEISVEDISASEDYLSLEADYTQKYNRLWFNYGGSAGANADIQAYEYFLTMGFKNQEIFNSSYIMGYKGKIIKENDLDITYSGPFIGVNTTF